MTYPFIRYEQPGGVFYACKIPAAEAISRLEIRRRRDGEEGIQRDEDQHRVRAIAKYLGTENAIIPTPILVSANSGRVQAVDGQIKVDSDDSSWGHILDGQHRVLGLRMLDPEVLSRIELLIVFVFDIDVYAEATVFATINSNQKQVSKSLIYDLFGLDEKWSVEKACHEIVKSLNEDRESPFFKRVKMLGRKVEETETLSQAAFIDRIKDAVRAAPSSGLALFLAPGREWEARKILENAFLGIQIALSHSDNRYPADYFFRTTGYGGVLKALNPIIEFGRNRGTLKPELFAQVFAKMLFLHPDPPVGTGNSAQISIQDRILEALTEVKALSQP